VWTTAAIPNVGCFDGSETLQYLPCSSPSTDSYNVNYNLGTGRCTCSFLIDFNGSSKARGAITIIGAANEDPSFCADAGLSEFKLGLALVLEATLLRSSDVDGHYQTPMVFASGSNTATGCATVRLCGSIRLVDISKS
jgi:hypothetical protein